MSEIENSKTILSWDVGIKNLAYCMMTQKDTDFRILKWNVINLIDDQQKCEFVLKNGNCCQEVAKFYIHHKTITEIFSDKSEGKYSCTRHKTKITPLFEEIVIDNKKSKKKVIKNCCCLCSDDATYKLTNTDYCWCDKHCDKGKALTNKIHVKRVIVSNCNKQAIQDLAEKLFNKLDNNIDDFMSVDEVIIENQPTLKNPKMKNLASMLYSYFVLRGITDKVKNQSKISLVKFISPQNKLKVNDENTNKVLNESTKNNVYKMTKKLGIEYCKALINDNDLQLLNTIKKKDDMCDAFLQGFRYLFNIVPLVHFQKLEKIGFDQS